MTPSLPQRISLGLLALSALLAAPGLTSAAESANSLKTAITNVYAGQSAIRFANPRVDAPATLNVNVFGVSDETMIGSFKIEVPAMASIEVHPEEILQTFAPVNWNQLVVLYVESTDDQQLWQHLRRNAVSGDLDNAGVCTYSVAGSLPPGNLVLNATLLHSIGGTVDPYASFISLHNMSDRAVTYEARLFDAVTGEARGRVDVALAAHGTFNQSSAWYQTNGGWYFPRPNEKHMNIVFVPKDGTQSTKDLIISHVLMNVVAGDSLNLSNPCPIHGAAAVLPPGGRP
jgi:hypothetical protein